MTTIISGNTAASSFVVSGDTTGDLVLDAKSGIINANTTTGGFVLPTGTSGQRPTAVNGMIRYSSSANAFEMYANGAWAAANVSPVPVNTVAPVVSGAAANGALLSCTTGTWNNSPNTYFYQWSANSVAISGSTSSTITLGASQVNANITCSVTAQNAAGNSIPAVSNSVGPVANSYLLTKSLRFRASASAYLNRTLSASNRKTFTFNAWVKKSVVGSSTGAVLFCSTDNTTSTGWLHFNTGAYGSADTLTFEDQVSGTVLVTTQVFRDPSAWYMITLSIDTTQATASNRARLFVNGTQVTAFSTATYPSQNADTNFNRTTSFIHTIGSQFTNNRFFDGYMAEINFIDGQALTPSSFGITDTNTGVWQPIRYSGTYGTNGFYLPFTNTTSTTTLVADSSGNGNNWTPNNISLTAGVTYDSMTDVPTNTDTNTGNYAVLNPLWKGANITPTDGNLTNPLNSGSPNAALSTMPMSTGKWYAEMTNTSAYSTVGICIVASNLTAPTFTIGVTTQTGLWEIYDNGGGIYVTSDGGAFSSSLGSSRFLPSGTIQFAYDADNGYFWIGRNNTWYDSSFGTTGNPSTGANPTFTISSSRGPFNIGAGSNSATNPQYWNFGQRPFTYTPPTGFLALNTSNLPNPTTGTSSATQANKYFDISLYTGTDGVAGSVTGLAFQPDFVWGKRRNVGSHTLYDAVRGATKEIYSDLTSAETTNANGLTSFNSSGFSYGGSSVLSNGAIVAWQWNAGGSNATNTSGSITSTVRASTTAGFSIVTYTGNGTNATVGHGLGASPSMIIVKKRSATDPWPVYHITTGVQQYIFLNATDAVYNNLANYWGSTSPSSTTFGLGPGYGGNNSNGSTYVAYCFAAVSGYSAFGSYTGNGSSDGPFVFTGFRPRFVLIKKIQTGVGNGEWYIHDTARDNFNQARFKLYPSSSVAENGISGETTTTNAIDILSNGFKLRTGNGATNESSISYIYAAFAETPFKFANAR